jgi:L-threonylcarbamoyladenylate synthase
MKTIQLSVLQGEPSLYSEVKAVLDNEGLLCFPAPSGYKLAVALHSPKAITAMLQAKRRIKNAPALVLVPSENWVQQVAASVSNEARSLMKTFWPGPVTLLFEASDELHPNVRKPLTKAKGWLGVRMPHDEVSLSVVRTFGKPILVSSANLAKKQGATSVAQVKKNFGRAVDLLIDAGDLKEGPKSTLVDMTNTAPTVIRCGAVSEDQIRDALAGDRTG